MAFVPPDLTQCAHCKSFMAEGVMTPNARAEVLVTVSMLRMRGGETLGYALCGMCSLKFGEFVEPTLKENAEWQAGVEEVRRAVESRGNDDE